VIAPLVGFEQLDAGHEGQQRGTGDQAGERTEVNENAYDQYQCDQGTQELARQRPGPRVGGQPPPDQSEGDPGDPQRQLVDMQQDAGG
jgi:hypothetical protein